MGGGERGGKVEWRLTINASAFILVFSFQTRGFGFRRHLTDFLELFLMPRGSYKRFTSQYSDVFFFLSFFL